MPSDSRVIENSYMHHRCHEYSYEDEYLSATPMEKLGSSLHLSIIRRPGESHRSLNKSWPLGRAHAHTHTDTQSKVLTGEREREKERKEDKTTQSSVFLFLRVTLERSEEDVGGWISVPVS